MLSRMLRQVFILIAGPLFLGAALLFVITVIKTVAAYRDLLKTGKGLKIADGFSIWAGHVNSVLFGEGQMYILDDLCRRFNAKTVGLLYGPNKAVATVDLKLLRRMILEEHEINRYVMDNIPIKEMDAGCIFTEKDDRWCGIRRAFAPALKSNKFKTPNVQRQIKNSIEKLVSSIETKLERSEADTIRLNIEEYAHRYSLDLVFSCFFKQDNVIDFNARVDSMTRIIDSGYQSMMWSPVLRLGLLFPILRSAIDWLVLQFHPYGIFKKKVMDFIKQQTKLNFEARKELMALKGSHNWDSAGEEDVLLRDGTNFSRNMIDHVIDQFYERKLSRDEYFHSMWLLVGAAAKTPSDTIAHTVYQLATHSDVQEKLRKSISAEGEESEYLSWVINESLRLLPPVPVGCSRMASRDYECEDGTVPAGSYVITASYSIHRLQRYWGPDANEFRPERFADAKDFHPMQFIPFGAGARGCPGKEFAMHELKKLFCALLTRYRFHCEPMEVKYSSPFFILQLSNRHMFVKISRVSG